jgi:hypothetical protein
MANVIGVSVRLASSLNSRVPLSYFIVQATDSGATV